MPEKDPPNPPRHYNAPPMLLFDREHPETNEEATRQFFKACREYREQISREGKGSTPTPEAPPAAQDAPPLESGDTPHASDGSKVG